MPTAVRSFCKINLGLAIGLPRADGFHALTTGYQTLAAHDRLTVQAELAAATSIHIRSNHEGVPTGSTNTVWKMIERALPALKTAAAVHVHIDKRLPVQGGIGAGSANAVAALLGLERELARYGVAPLPERDKLRIAAEVGSDVPLFLVGGAVLGVARGEQVSPLSDLPSTPCVLALPDIGVPTPQAYRDWDALHPAPEPAPAASSALTPPPASDKLLTLSRALASVLAPRPPEAQSAGGGTHSSGVLAQASLRREGLAGKSDENPLLALVRTGIENDFEEVVFRQYPFLGTIRRILADSGNPEEAALYAALSGSGSALFGLYGSDAAAAAAEHRLGEAGIRSMRTRTLPRAEYWRMMFEP
ncbi:MAG TPA: 4-(cytidine 5'-diphospho)-2-C-methyl-D-erythritol kinase [Acidobacteriaceae bacterium]|jgi:4-diphosphocytidyl-2-C-methyl-D-erythritol kinase|nr:4-(cytidine 5'-diphospho)-2-C-methyl-D-erythritol kinase [Acidobacteriaceae bacterium]